MKSEDMIDLRDVIARVEELEQEIEQEGDLMVFEEMAKLTALLDECKGLGGDEEWRDDWYPATLIKDSYFETYAQELADEIGVVDPAASWPLTCIDWEQAARELQMDYTSVEFDGNTYWTR
jgi:hypothetical protein